jgi:hypothetical protein
MYIPVRVFLTVQPEPDAVISHVSVPWPISTSLPPSVKHAPSGTLQIVKLLPEPYWFEESLLAFLRQSDLLRVQQRELLSSVSIANPIASKVFDAIPAKRPWLGLSWRQYMWWFAEVEKRLDLTPSLARDLIQQADENRGTLEKSPKLFMEERSNDGSWLRQWLRVLEELPSFE